MKKFFHRFPNKKDLVLLVFLIGISVGKTQHLVELNICNSWSNLIYMNLIERICFKEPINPDEYEFKAVNGSIQSIDSFEIWVLASEPGALEVLYRHNVDSTFQKLAMFDVVNFVESTLELKNVYENVEIGDTIMLSNFRIRNYNAEQVGLHVPFDLRSLQLLFISTKGELIDHELVMKNPFIVRSAGRLIVMNPVFTNSVVLKPNDSHALIIEVIK